MNLVKDLVFQGEGESFVSIRPVQSKADGRTYLYVTTDEGMDFGVGTVETFKRDVEGFLSQFNQPSVRPQDPMLNGEGWTFETMEHGGAEPDTMPEAIRGTDAQGRSAVYILK